MPTDLSSATVYVVDDDDAVRDSVRFLMESVDLRCKTYPSARDFLDDYDEDSQGCLILDVRMAGMSGLELQAALNDRRNLLPIVFVTGHGDVPMAVEAMQAGAYDFLEKPYRNQELLDCVNSAINENHDAHLRRAALTIVSARHSRLTKREKQVMALMATGKPNKLIARELGVSPRTIELHRRRVFGKMQTKTLAELVEFSIQLRAQLESEQSR